MKLLVLAGGFGTRLKTVVSQVPKPMAPAGELPFLGHLLYNWHEQGVRDFTFLLHHMASSIEQFIQSLPMRDLLKDCSVSFIREPEPMGTGGAIAFALKNLGIKGRFLVANADTWLDNGIVELARLDSNALAAVYVPDTARYGKLKFRDNKVIDFVEKNDSHGDGWINAGLCSLDSRLFQTWNQRPFSLEQTIFPQLVATADLKYIKLNTRFIDIGIPEDYQRFCSWIEQEKKESL